MHRYLIFMLIIFAACFLGAWHGEPPEESSPTASLVAVQDTFNQTEALALLREQIKGKEQLPADSVFQNIQLLKKVPAGRLLAIMEVAYAKSLGVTCAHCHLPDDWASEAKPAKQITREMWAMVRKINSELLAEIPNLNSAQPTVNCTTCHRGQVKPALSLEK